MRVYLNSTVTVCCSMKAHECCILQHHCVKTAFPQQEASGRDSTIEHHQERNPILSRPTQSTRQPNKATDTPAEVTAYRFQQNVAHGKGRSKETGYVDVIKTFPGCILDALGVVGHLQHL
jgi:hypothetical protein